MSDTNRSTISKSSPTRVDVLREFTRIEDVPHVYSVALPRVGPNAELMAEEIVRLRAQRDVIRKKLEAITDVVDDTTAAEIDAVLAALREGGDDGR